MMPAKWNTKTAPFLRAQYFTMHPGFKKVPNTTLSGQHDFISFEYYREWWNRNTAVWRGGLQKITVLFFSPFCLSPPMFLWVGVRTWRSLLLSMCYRSSYVASLPEQRSSPGIRGTATDRQHLWSPALCWEDELSTSKHDFCFTLQACFRWKQ